MRSGSSTPPPRLASYFVRTFLEQPRLDATVPSLVYVDDHDRIVGFIGAMEHRLRFDGRPIRMVSSGPLISDPDASLGAGAFLLRRLMSGPQDVTITDAASDAVRRMWGRFGGETLHLSSIRWTRLFSPTRCIAEHFLERPQRNGARRLPRSLGIIASPALRAADAIVTRIPRNPFVTRAPDSVGEPLTPRAIVEELPSIAGPLRLRPDYDEGFLAWLFRELGDIRSRGHLHAVLVRRSEDKRVLGWFVCFIRPTGLGTVLQVVARDDGAGAVIDHLFHYAREAGAHGLIGRLEPGLVSPLASRRCALFNTGQMFALIHSRIPELIDVVRSGQALMTWMDGESVFGHWSEAFT